MSTTLIFQDYHYGGKIANYKMGSIIKYKNKYQISYFGNTAMLVENAKNLTEAKKRLDILSEEKIKKQGLKAPAKKKTAVKNVEIQVNSQNIKSLDRYDNVEKFESGKTVANIKGVDKTIFKDDILIISKNKVIGINKPKYVINKGLKAPVKKKTLKTKKSVACSKVLKLMDKDYSYQKALKEVLNSDKRLNKKKLETELNNYI